MHHGRAPSWGEQLVLMTSQPYAQSASNRSSVRSPQEQVMWAYQNPLAASPGAYPGSTVPEPWPGAAPAAVYARKGSYKDLLPDSSPLVVLRQQALSQAPGAQVSYQEYLPAYQPHVPPAAVHPSWQSWPAQPQPAPHASHFVPATASAPGLLPTAMQPGSMPLGQEAPARSAPVPYGLPADASPTGSGGAMQDIKSKLKAQLAPAVPSAPPMPGATAAAAAAALPVDQYSSRPPEPRMPAPGTAADSQPHSGPGAKASAADKHASRFAREFMAQQASESGAAPAPAAPPAVLDPQEEARQQAQVMDHLLQTLDQHRRVVSSGPEPRAATASMDALQTHITQQVAALYTHFKEQQEQDRSKIRQLSQALKTQDDRVAMLRNRNVQLEMDRSDADGGPGGDCSKAGMGRPANVVFLPYTLHPALRKMRWVSLLMASFQQKRTTWLAITWAVIFITAVSLLIGLLVPWHKPPAPPNFTLVPSLLNLTIGGLDISFKLDRECALYYTVIPSPLINQPSRRRRRLQARQSGPGQAAGSRMAHQGDQMRTGSHAGITAAAVQHGRGTALRALHQQEAVSPVSPPLPALLNTTSPSPSPAPAGPQPMPRTGVLSWVEAQDLVDLTVGKQDAKLARYAAACGRTVVPDRPYPYSLSAQSSADSLECVTSLYGGVANGSVAGNGAPGACLRCGRLYPLQQPYMVLLVAVRENKGVASKIQVLDVFPAANGTWLVRTTVLQDEEDDE